MFLSTKNPVYNTIIVFTIIMLLLYTIKPSVIYNDKINEFRQFGTTDGKTLLPIYVIGILLAVLLYIFFNHYTGTQSNDHNTGSLPIVRHGMDIQNHNIQQQIQQLHNQIQYLINQQSIISYQKN